MRVPGTPMQWLVAAAAVQMTVATAATLNHSPSSSDEAKVLGVTSSRTSGSGDSGQGKNQGKGNDGKDVVATGSIQGLYPGGALPLVLTLANDNNFPVDVTSIVVTPAAASAACSASMLRIDEFHGVLQIEKSSTATQALTARLHSDAPDACKNQQWALTYFGTAVKK